MASIRLEDRLDGISNYLQWKVRMTTIFKENKLWALVTTVVVPPSNDPIALDIHEVKEAKAQRLILDGVKDPLIPHLAEKKTAKEMWEALKNLYEAKNENRKMALKDKLHSIKMTMGESVVPYLTRLAQVKDELAAVGEVISDSELVRIALRGFTKDWEVFVKCIVGREKLPDWSRLWDDFTQEEIWVNGEKGGEGVVEENFALLLKGKGKSKKGSRIDINKVRCFACNEYGHYAAQCPNKKGTKEKEKEKQVAASAEVNDFSEKFEKEFSLVSIVSSGNNNNFEFDRTWMVDSGATSHMTGMLDSFLFISEIGPDHVVNGTHQIRGVDSVRFLLDFGETLEVEGVLFVPGLRVNLLSVSALEDVGYVITFERGYVHIHAVDEVPIRTVLIGERRGRVYTVLGQPVRCQSGWISDSEGEQEAQRTEGAPECQSSVQGSSTSRKINWYELSQSENAQRRDRISRSISRRHSSTRPVQRQHSGSEGATAADSLESGNGPGSGNVRRTSLVKREC
jgi:hypothetical protein